MSRILNQNLTIMVLAATRLAELCDDMVFIGGCATGLLITDPAAPKVRPTIDVDVMVEAASRSEYYLLEKKLRAKGFQQIMFEDAPICRWQVDDIILDVMPTNPEILGFVNKWYIPAMENAEPVTLENNVVVNMITAPYFLATKMEAFLDRGDGDYYGSSDLEDIIAVIDGRPEVIDEIQNGSEELKKYLAETISNLLQDNSFADAIPAHLPPDEASQARAGLILERLELIIKTNAEVN